MRVTQRGRTSTDRRVGRAELTVRGLASASMSEQTRAARPSDRAVAGGPAVSASARASIPRRAAPRPLTPRAAHLHPTQVAARPIAPHRSRMPADPAIEFREAKLGEVPIRELGLRIAGTPLEPILAEFEAELRAVGLTRVRPRFYLSTEWGVPFETVAIAIPFYLARPDLAELHADRTGMIEGEGREEILRYLRHEMGHVVNYAYRLYERPEWIERFGAITQPYEDEYRPEPWSTRYVHHLPGWYAQKHPDEDWAETFAIWMTPDADWRADYATWPEALRKLELCDALMRTVAPTEPLVTDDELDEDVGEIDYSIEDFYEDSLPAYGEFPPGLDGALRAIFLPPSRDRDCRAGVVIRRHARALARSVFTWTGHFPEQTRALLEHLASRADALGLTCPDVHEPQVIVALTAFVTSLAMNHVHRGSYLP